MPAKKPIGLSVRHNTKAEKAQREAAEASMRSDRELPMNPPASLKEHPIAQATWRRLMREYTAIEAQIVGRLDLDLLTNYCILSEQAAELDLMRKKAFASWQEGNPTAYDEVVKLDGRADRKRALMLQMSQTLYLTPRSRAGVMPKAKEEPQPKDDLEELLGQVENMTNARFIE